MIKYAFVFFCFIGLMSCVPSRSFIAGTVEPVVIEKKGELQASISMRPNKYAQADFGYALNNRIVLKCSAAGFYRFGNFMGSVLYNTSVKNVSFYAGPLFNYQRNYISIKAQDFSGTLFYYYSYNCEYYSPGAILGISLKGEDGYRKHHLIIKPQYNVVNKYEYNNLIANRETATNNEHLSYKIPNFFSLEIAYALLIKMENNNYFKLQGGITLLQKTYRHSYSFNPYDTPYDHSPYGGLINKTTSHPLSWPVNFSIGFIFSSKKG